MTSIVVAGFQHETNTFAPFPTTMDLFEQRGGWPELVRGRRCLTSLGAEHPACGLYAACQHKMVPILWAGAEPGGYSSQIKKQEYGPTQTVRLLNSQD